MIYSRRKNLSGSRNGFYRFENTRNRSGMQGYGDGDFIRLRDEYGVVWTGTAEPQEDSIVRFRFRDADGNCISGVSDTFGIVLRDDKGNTWRGFVE